MTQRPSLVCAIDGFGVMRLARVTAGLAQHERAPHHPRHQIDLGGFRHRLVHRARDELALARAEAIEQRGDDRERELLAGDVDRRATSAARSAADRTCRRVGIVAAVHHHAAEREMHQVRALEVGPRTVIAERRTRARRSAPGTARDQRRSRQPDLVELAARRRLEQDVGARDERAEALAIFRPLQVEHDRALAAVVVPEEQRALGIRAVLVERADAARGAAAGRLDLDDLGAEARQRQPAVLGLLVGELDDADAGEGTPAGRRRCRHGLP